MSEPLDKKLVGQATYDNIRNDIVSGALKPGEKLKLNELRSNYKASVSTLREILMRLVSDGFVAFEEQKGFRVVPVSIDDLKELVELRVHIEALGLRKSMENSDVDWKSRLVGAHFKLSTMEKLMLEDEKKHCEDWVAADWDFHKALMSNCGSKQLQKYHASIIHQFMRYQLLALKKVPFRGRTSTEEHQQILEGVLGDDIEGTVELLSAHISKGASLPVENSAS